MFLKFKKFSKSSIILILAGILLVGIIIAQEKSNSENLIEHDFIDTTDEILLEIQNSVDSIAEVLHGIGQFFKASNKVDTKEFEIFVKHSKERFGISTICYYDHSGYLYSFPKEHENQCIEYKNIIGSNFDYDDKNFYLREDVFSSGVQKGNVLMVTSFKSLIAKLKLPTSVSIIFNPNSAMKIEKKYRLRDGKVSYNTLSKILDVQVLFKDDSAFSHQFSAYFHMTLLLVILLIIAGVNTIESNKSREYLIGVKLKQQEDQLNAQFEELIEQKRKANINSRLASIGELAAGVGHEINNPVTIILGKIFTLKKNGSFTETQLDIIKSIENAAERIERITSSLRNFSRLSNIDNHIQFDLFTTTENTINMLKDLNTMDDITFELSKCGAGLPLVFGDPGLFQQVLINLITNAKDSFQLDQLKIIKIEIQAEGEFALLSISDNGSGITQENLEKIFNPFFTTKDVGKGTGIGLSLVQKFVTEEFKGEITVESELNKGTTFTIRVPLFS